MHNRVVEIEELTLRIPGVDAAAARKIAEDIADRLARSVPSWSADDLPRIAALRVTLPPGVRRDQIARIVADEIAKALR